MKPKDDVPNVLTL